MKAALLIVALAGKAKEENLRVQVTPEAALVQQTEGTETETETGEPDQSKQVTKLNDDQSKDQASQEAKLTSLETKMNTDTTNLKAAAEPKLEQVERGLEKTGVQNSEFEKATLQKANDLDTLGTGYYSEIQTAAADASAAAKKTKNLIDVTANKYKDEWGTSADEALAEISAQNQETEQDASAKKTAISTEAEETNEAAKEADEELTDEVDETTEEFEDMHDEFSDTAKDARGELKDVAKEYKGAAMEAKKDVQSIKNQADKLPGEIAKGKRDVEKEITGGIKDAYKEAAANLKSSKKEALSAAKEQKKEAKTEAKEIAATSKDDFKTLAEEAKDVDSDDYDKLTAAAEAIGGLSSAATSMQTLGEALRSDTASLESGSNQRIEQASSALNREIKAAGAAIAIEAQEMEGAVKNKIIKSQQKARTTRTSLQNQAMQNIKQAVADLQADVKRGSNEITTADEELRTSVATQEEEIKGNRAALEQNDGAVLKQMDEIRQQQGDGSAKLTTSMTTFNKDIEDATAGLDTFAEEATAKTKEDADKALVVAHQAADSAQQMLTQRVEQIATQARTRLQQGQTNIEEALKRMVDKNDDMSVSLDQVKKDTADVKDELPAAKEAAESAIGDVKTELSAVDAALKKSMITLGSVIESEETKGQEQVQTEAAAMQKTLDQEVTTAVAAVDEQKQNTLKLGQGLAAAVAKDKEETTLEEDKMKAEIDQGLKDAVVMSDANKQEGSVLTDKVNTLKAEVKEQGRAFTREGAKLAAEARNQALTAFGQAKAEVEQTLDQSEKSGEERTQQQYSKATAELTATRNGIDGYVAGKEEQLVNVTGEYHNLQKKYSALNGEAEQIGTDLTNEMGSVMQAQKGVQDSVESLTEHEKSLLAQKTKELDDTVKKKTEESIAQQHDALSALVQTENADIHNVETEQKLNAAQAENKLKGFIADNEAKVNQVKAGVSSVHASSKELEGAAQKAVGEISAESAALKSDLQMGEDQTNMEMQNSEKELVGIQGEGTEVQEGLVGALKAAEEEEGEETGALESEFKEQTKQYQEKADSEIGAVVTDLDRVAGSTPNVGPEFLADTADTRTSLGESMERLLGSGSKESALIGTLDTRLQDVRNERETMAKKLHKDISAMKGSAATSVDSAILKVQQMTQETKMASDKMMDELRKFGMQMGGLEGTESSAEKEEIDALGDNLFKLKSMGERLKTWVMHNKARTKAWRNEVRKAIVSLMASIGMDADHIKNEQVQEELDLNKDLRKMQLHLEDEVSANAVHNAEYFQGMVGNTMGKMHSIISESEHEDKNKQQDEQRASSDLAQDKKLMTDEIANVKDNEDELEAKAAELSANTQAAVQQIQNNIFLPKMTLQSGDGAEKKIQALETTMNRMNLATSLIQTASSTMTGDGADAQELAEEQEIAALKELNDELEAENAKLTSENTNLEKGLAALPPLAVTADHASTL
jgi:hypothetical protein